MDPLTRSRRGLGSRDTEDTGLNRDQEYAAALSQVGADGAPGVRVSETLMNGVVQGEASPGTLESGQAQEKEVSSALPVASPFHSEYVRAEVELVRNRPATLDSDASRLREDQDGLALGESVNRFPTEPDYSALQGPSSGGLDAPRVARVEPASDDQARVTSPRGGSTQEADYLAADMGSRISKPAETEEVEAAFGISEVGLGRERVSPDDPRELVPADRLGNVEALLYQVLEENRTLKRRLEQNESRSHSSWYSGVAHPEPQLSTATFGPRSEGEVQRFLSAEFPGHAAGGCLDPRFMGFGNRLGEVFPGGPHSWAAARSEASMANMVAGLSQRSLEMPSLGRVGEPFLGRMAPPPPLPLPPVPVGEAVGEPEAPQTMRQFTEAVRGSHGYHTPRGDVGDGARRFDSSGYPLSPGGTVIRPPPVPPSLLTSERMPIAGAPGLRSSGFPGDGISGGLLSQVRPEEPAKYISELPKLASADLATSAIVCGNWLAQVRQMLIGLSPSAGVWWQGVEGPVNVAYQRWLIADPLGRLAVDPASVKGEYDEYLYGRVESRAVTLLLAAIPANVRDDVVTNRWLSTTAILFRIFCLFQPGGSTERAHLLAQLVNPEVCKSFSECIKVLRRWNQSLQRASEIHATLPDPSLLLRGVDAATGGLLASNQMVGFRVNSFRHRLGIDYNPTVASVLQLVKLIQAEAEASAIATESNPDKRARAAAAAAASATTAPAGGACRDPPGAKSAPAVPPPPPPVVSAISGGGPEGKDKSKGKGKGSGADSPLCHKFADASGCRYGDVCMFKHDRAKAEKEGRCLACGQPGHFRSDCTVVPLENRQATDEAGAGGSPKASGPGRGVPKPKPKAKSTSVAKGVTEEAGSQEGSASSSAGVSAKSASPSVSPEALVAEATKLLKGVSLRAVRVDYDSQVDVSWVRSALASASDPDFCLVDSGATNALRPASEGEIEGCKVIRVDLAFRRDRLEN